MSSAKTSTYTEAVGRRKTAVARVRITPAATSKVSVNDKDLNAYFPTAHLQELVVAPLERAGGKTFAITARIVGGGVNAQAEALRHGLSRALVDIDATVRGNLKKAGFLTRDPRAKERRKFGLKKARKASQWSKR